MTSFPGSRRLGKPLAGAVAVLVALVAWAAPAFAHVAVHPGSVATGWAATASSGSSSTSGGGGSGTTTVVAIFAVIMAIGALISAIAAIMRRRGVSPRSSRPSRRPPR